MKEGSLGEVRMSHAAARRADDQATRKQGGSGRAAMPHGDVSGEEPMRKATEGSATEGTEVVQSGPSFESTVQIIFRFLLRPLCRGHQPR